MKNFPLVFVLSFLFHSCLFGQFQMGPKIGVNLSDIRESQGILNPQTATYYYGGLHLKYPFSSHWSIVADLQYIQRGYQNNPGFNTMAPTLFFRMDYLEFIPQASYALTSFLDVRLGLGTSLRLDERLKEEGGDWQDTFVDIGKDFELVGLAGVKASIQQIFVEAVFTHTLIRNQNLLFTDVNGTPLQNNLYNLGVQVGVGYLFSL